MKLALIILANKHTQGGVAGLIAGYILGSIWVGKEQDEMIRQLAQAVKLATGG